MLQAASEQDPVRSQVRTFIRHGWPSSVSDEFSAFHRVSEELSCWNEVSVARGLCAVIPSSLRGRVLTMTHKGHLGIKVKRRYRDLVWWPGIDRDLEALVRDCAACLVSGKTGNDPEPPLQPLTCPSQPWEHLQLDICGELHCVPHHKRFLVVVYDLYSKWPEVAAVGTVTTRAVTDILESVFARWGLPNVINTDNGPQLISAEFSAFLESKGIKHIHMSFYNPKANSVVERFNCTLKNGNKAHTAQGCSFHTALLQTLLYYRASQHSTTMVTPASLMLGWELQLPLDEPRPPLTPAPPP